MTRAWRPPLDPGAAEARAAAALAAQFELPVPVGRALYFRGLTTSGALRDHLEAASRGVPETPDLPDLAAAARRVAAACREGEKILVHGDYDVDGICGTALLTRTLERWGARPAPFLPSRFEDGYGISPAAIEKARRERFALLITADCGSNHGALLDEAAAAGAAVIVCDHHLLVENRQPKAALLINPHRPDDASGMTGFCGTAIALQLLLATAQALGRTAEPASLAMLAAIASVADVMPLRGAARALVAAGLKRLPEARAPGLRALARACRLLPPVRAEDVGFAIGPRLNAAGRMGHPGDALELLLARDAPAAARAMGKLEESNERRREVSARVFVAALREAETQGDRPVVIVGGENWHLGVMGIVAQRLREATGKPALAVAFDDGGLGTGSGRSVPGVHLEGLLARQRGHLVRAGGHAAACGLTIERKNWEEFRGALWADPAASARPAPEPIRADAALAPSDAGLELLSAIHALEPWGEGMAAPKFELAGVLQSARRFGRDAGKPHAELTLKGAPLPLVWWRGAGAIPAGASAVRLLIRPGRDRWVVEDGDFS